MNHETLYLKEAFGPSIEFPNEAGVFQLEVFPSFYQRNHVLFKQTLLVFQMQLQMQVQ